MTETPLIQTSVRQESADFTENVRYHQGLLDDLRLRLERVRQGGSEESVKLHRRRGKLTARERIARLRDPGSEFLELSPMAAFGMYGDEVPSAGLVTGIGSIAQRLCLIVANDATVKGGTYYPETIRKHIRAQEIALENRLYLRAEHKAPAAGTITASPRVA